MSATTSPIPGASFMEHYDINSRIAVLETEMKNIANEIKSLRLDSKEQHMNMMEKIQDMDHRLDVIEKWRWMLIGGAAVVGYLVSHFFVK